MPNGNEHKELVYLKLWARGYRLTPRPMTDERREAKALISARQKVDAQITENARRRNWCSNDPRRIIDRARCAAKKGSESLRISQAKYRAKNRALLNAKSLAATKARRKADPVFRLSHRLRTRLFVTVRNIGGGKSSSRTAELFGCTSDELRAHLENQFVRGMTWANYGEWHVDHIRPCASFDLTDRAQQHACFHFTNLRPLWAADNIAKKDKWVGQLVMPI